MPGAGTSKGTYDRALALVQHSQNSGVPAPSRDTKSSPRCGTVWVGGAEGVPCHQSDGVSAASLVRGTGNSQARSLGGESVAPIL